MGPYRPRASGCTSALHAQKLPGSTSLPTLSIMKFKIFKPAGQMSLWFWAYLSLISNGAEYLFLCLLATWVSFVSRVGGLPYIWQVTRRQGSWAVISLFSRCGLRGRVTTECEGALHRVRTQQNASQPSPLCPKRLTGNGMPLKQWLAGNATPRRSWNVTSSLLPLPPVHLGIWGRLSCNISKKRGKARSEV